MSDKVDLSGEIRTAIDGAYARGNPVVLGYTDPGGRPSLSVRGSIHVHGVDQLALWARSTTSGLVASIKERPNVSILFFGSNDQGPRMLLSIVGRAHQDSSCNDQVYQSISDTERDHDPEGKGVAVIVDVDRLSGVSMETGPLDQVREGT